MKIKFKGSFSSYIINSVATWIKEHLTDLTIMERPIYVCECKITKVGKREILVEGENN